MNIKLLEILNYYKETWNVSDDINDIYNELISNNVEVFKNSFYCEIETEQGLVLLAGTKDKADLWVLKKIIKLINTNKRFFTILNGNSLYLLEKLTRYNYIITKKDGDTSFLIFNPQGE